MRDLLSKGEFYFALLLVIIVSLFVYDSFHLSFQARLIPLVVAIPTAIMLILIALSTRFPRLISFFDSREKRREREGNAAVVSGGAPGAAKPALSSVLGMSAWVVLLFSSILLLGFYVTTPLYVLLYLKLHGHARWLASVLNSLAAGGLVYASFHIVMKLELFQGVAFGARLPSL